MTEFAELRERLVDELRDSHALQDDRVAAAMLTVPRHLFLPDAEPEQAYLDEAVVTKSDDMGRAISSSSQPAIMTIMLEQLGVQPGHQVLEVGAGTGYNAALLAYLAGASGSVTTVDVDDDIVSAAREHLAAGGYGRVSVVHGDGGLGWPPDAPYDRIIATVGAWDILPAWLDQLRPGGRLVLPLAIRPAMQYSIAFERVAGHLESRSLRPCGFMRLRGTFAGPETLAPIGEGRNLFAEVGPRPPGAEELEELLGQPGERVDTGITVTLSELWGGLGLWLAGREPGLGRLSGQGVRSLPGPASSAVAGGRMGTVMMVSAHGCTIAARPDDPGEATGEDDEAAASPAAAAKLKARSRKPFELAAWPFGRDGAELAARLAQHTQEWEAAGRPSPGDLSVTAYPAETSGPAGAAGAAVIDKQYTRLVLSWRDGTGTAGETSGCE
ncbi:MAG TPA: methyltransferase, FxLD system [Streptosporangiaceae bacterium]